jgi:hypothetical protein
MVASSSRPHLANFAKKEGALFHSFAKRRKKDAYVQNRNGAHPNAVVLPHHCDVPILTIERNYVKDCKRLKTHFTNQQNWQKLHQLN